jgi:hypothetical protein
MVSRPLRHRFLAQVRDDPLVGRDSLLIPASDFAPNRLEVPRIMSHGLNSCSVIKN